MNDEIHPNIKTIIPPIVRKLLASQDKFKRIIDPKEKDYEKLQSLDILLKEINTLYFYSKSQQKYSTMICVDHKDIQSSPLYVEIKATSYCNDKCITQFICNKHPMKGTIFINTNVSMFMKICTRNMNNEERNLIYKFLEKHEIQIDEINEKEFNEFYVFYLNN